LRAPQKIQPLWQINRAQYWNGLNIDTAIRLRWALRDIKAKRTKLSPVSPDDLGTLIEMGLVEMKDDIPELTSEGHRALGGTEGEGEK